MTRHCFERIEKLSSILPSVQYRPDMLREASTSLKIQEMASATKSVVSILTAIAIDQHLIKGIDEKVSTFFPEYVGVCADMGPR